jgi:hypothetical protein
MRRFNIDEIKLVDDNNGPKDTELLTGDIIKGLAPNSTVTPNVETEGNEYVQFPDGVTQKIVGNTHEKGGVKMSIPDGTKIISKYLLLTPAQVRALNKQFELNLTTEDSYAKAMDKYTAKIGLKKLNKEQEEILGVLKKEMSNVDVDKKTHLVNLEYLSKKISNLENLKKPLEDLRATFFNNVYEMQEGAKANGKPREPKVKKEDDDSDDLMRKGGMSRKNFERVCQQFGLTPEQGEQVLRNGGRVLPSFVNGGDTEPPVTGLPANDIPFTYTYGKNVYKPQPRVKQSAQGQAGYGAVTETQDALQQLYTNFPDIVQSTFGKYIEVDSAGNVKFKGGINLGKQQQIVLDAQQKMNDRMNESAKVILNDPTAAPEEKENARKWLETETFTGAEQEGWSTEQKVRAYDQKLGQFTAGRQSIGVNLVTEDDLKKLRAQGITTVKQISPDILATLSPESRKRYEAFKPKLTENADFFINPIAQEVPPITVTPPKKEPKPQPKIEDKVRVPAIPRGPRMFFTPDQSTLMPTGMEAQLRGDIRLERIDPVRIGIEQNLQEIANQRAFATQQIEGLPEAQKASVLANLMANANKAANQAATAANITNAQNIAQAELFNVQQAGNEQLYNLNNALSFEQRQLTAKAKTEEELRNFYDYNRKVNNTNFLNQQRLNLMGTLFPDYTLDFMGMVPEYAPTSEFQIDPSMTSVNEALKYLSVLNTPQT